MAEIYLHLDFANEIVNKLNLKVDPFTLNIASCGPDPLYYNFTSKKANELGDRLHNDSSQKFFLNLCELVKNNNNLYTYSFLIGFIAHYVLDSTVHPYVYYSAGVFKKSDKSTYKYWGLHTLLEKGMDACIYRNKYNKSIRTLNLKKKYFYSKKINSDVSRIFTDVINKTYNLNESYSLYDESYLGLKKVIRLIITDYFGIKKAFFRIVDLFHKAPVRIALMSYFNIPKKYDYLNLKKRYWNNACTNSTPCNKTVIELIDDAYIECSNIIENVNLYLNGKDIDLKDVFINLSYDTGIDCDLSLPMKYFNIFK